MEDAEFLYGPTPAPRPSRAVTDSKGKTEYDKQLRQTMASTIASSSSGTMTGDTTRRPAQKRKTTGDEEEPAHKHRQLDALREFVCKRCELSFSSQTKVFRHLKQNRYQCERVKKSDGGDEGGPGVLSEGTKPLTAPQVSSGFRRLGAVEVTESDGDSEDEFENFPDGQPKRKVGSVISMVDAFQKRGCEDVGCRDAECQAQSKTCSPENAVFWFDTDQRPFGVGVSDEAGGSHRRFKFGVTGRP